MGMKTGWLGMAMLLGVLAGCGDGDTSGDAAGKVVDARFLADNAAWREERKSQLLAPDGWTSLVGLHWIELKSHFIGERWRATLVRISSGVIQTVRTMPASSAWPGIGSPTWPR